MSENRDSSGAQSFPSAEPLIGPVVSSAHLAQGASPALSELEYGLILCWHSFSRWIVRGMEAAGVAGLSAADVLILHAIRHRDRAKKLADICHALDIEDTHIATYAIRKLEKAGLLTSSRRGKEKVVAMTAKGVAVCEHYAHIRERLLVAPTSGNRPPEQTLSHIASALRLMSGAYNQAGRAATTL